MVDVGHRRDVHRQVAVVVDHGKLRDQPPVFDFPLADADLEFVFPARWRRWNAGNVLEHLVVAIALVRAANEVTRVERDAQPFHVVAEHDRRLGVLRDPPDLRLHADEHAVDPGDFDPLARVVGQDDSGVKRQERTVRTRPLRMLPRTRV